VAEDLHIARETKKKTTSCWHIKLDRVLEGRKAFTPLYWLPKLAFLMATLRVLNAEKTEIETLKNIDKMSSSLPFLCWVFEGDDSSFSN